MKAKQTVTELMELRSHIDHVLQQRMSQMLCLLWADVVGSTVFFQQHGDVQGRFFVQRHHDLVTPIVLQHHGKVIKTVGDAVMASFETAEQALDCAMEIQYKLLEARSHNTKEAIPQTKISLHYGQGLIETNDIYGDLVNMSARLNGMTEPEQILISHTVYQRVKERQEIPIMPLTASGWKEGEKGLPVYEVLWRQKAEGEGKAVALRTFEGGARTCFYCGLAEHALCQCPSKQFSGVARQLEQLGYQPLRHIQTRFRQANLHAPAGEGSTDGNLSEAFYDLSLPYQLRFLPKIWLANGSEDFSSLERQTVMAVNPLAGTRLWMGIDCVRVGRFEQAKEFLQSTLQSNPGDYKAQLGLGFLALEEDNPAAALQHWRKSLQQTKTPLQTAYVHLLIQRLYESNGKTQLAYQELQKALEKDRYCCEARYRQLALTVKESGGKDLSSRLRKLIQDDRSVYVKVVLDPAFATCGEALQPLLHTLYQEARGEALACLPRVTEALEALREWFPQPEGEFIAIERTLDRLRQHLKTDSYFGYHDAIHEGAALQANMYKVLERRKASLQHEYVMTVATLETRLARLSTASTEATEALRRGQTTALLDKCARLRSASSFDTAAAFWQAWGEVQKLKTALQELEATSSPKRSQTWRRMLWAILPYALGGVVMVDTTVFGILGYMMYFANLELEKHTLLLSLVWGGGSGLLLGSALGWCVQWYRSRR
jgi:class 3 adenylate cyclase/tetratricopeptide (TPR) repeat protein